MIEIKECKKEKCIKRRKRIKKKKIRKQIFNKISDLSTHFDGFSRSEKIKRK